jgi:dihydroorotate dehydrogenase (NAD+) catalytic subunit|tara:strand:- start:3249 stop:4946 length:1698 start_codon:yes stop_codon:yes gene_type:complete
MEIAPQKSGADMICDQRNPENHLSQHNNFLGKSVSGPFTIPSGIITTAAPIIQRLFNQVPQIGIVTTKSIGPIPREGNREPIMTQYAPGCFMNAVGLTNPGADEAAKQLSELEIPADRFLLTSVFGGSVAEIVEVALKLAPFSDGLELNLSCPHATGYGMDMGQDAALVNEITQAVKAAIDIPVVPKLTPNVPNIGEIASAAVEGGADAICAINTVGPAYFTAHGHTVLTNKLGGMSGRGILPVALKCVKEIREAVDVPIIACGGISNADDVRAFKHEGANVFGIGSALTGLDSDALAKYFQSLQEDLASDANTTATLIRDDVDMGFRSFKIVRNVKVTDDISILTFDDKLDVKAGEFVFAWLPGIGEKPFSALTDDPLSLVVIDVGIFTHQLLQLEVGTEVFFRGMYGVSVNPPENARIVTVAGGTGLAAVYQIARDVKKADIFLGARSKDRLYFTEECDAIANIHTATDDGSEGYHGVVTELLEEKLLELSETEREALVFYNCGPAPMILAAEVVEKKFVAPDRIFSAIDYMTKCGVGVCGACHSPDGRRLCVDGPFLAGESS